MKKTIGLFILSLVSYSVWGQTQVTGSVHVGAETAPSKETTVTDFDYTSSNHHYHAELDESPVNYSLLYGMDLRLRFHQVHSLRMMVDGQYGQERNMGNRTETLHNENGLLMSRLQSSYNHPNDRSHTISALAAYELALTQQSQLGVSYHYNIETEQGDLCQQIWEQTAFTRFVNNHYNSHSRVEEHQVDINYHHVFPFADGSHRITVGARYDYRQLLQQQMQQWDDVTFLEDTFLHQTHYGAIYAGYQLQYKTLTAMAQLEYRYSRMQQQNLHDVLPLARIAWHVRPQHTLSAQYGVLLIRPTLMHLNPAHVLGAYTDNYGVETLVGTHVHRVSLTYEWKGTQTSVQGNLFYVTANDGLSAIWLEKNDIQTNWWGNDGLRHAVGWTPSVDWTPIESINLHAEATVLWDKRVAVSIHMQSQHVGIAGQLRLTHSLPHGLSWSAHCDYSYGNTLNLYSYAGHGVKTGAEFHAKMLEKQNLHLTLRYDYLMQPSTYFTTPVSYTGTITQLKHNRHELSLRISYDF